MPLESNVKKLILSKTKKAINDLEKSDFDGMKKLITATIALTDLISDEKWGTEFKLSALIFGGVGSTTDSQFKEMDKEKQDRIIKTYVDILNSFYGALEEENIQKIDDTLKHFAKVFMDELFL